MGLQRTTPRVSCQRSTFSVGADAQAASQYGCPPSPRQGHWHPVFIESPKPPTGAETDE